MCARIACVPVWRVGSRKLYTKVAKLESKRNQSAKMKVEPSEEGQLELVGGHCRADLWLILILKHTLPGGQNPEVPQ